MHTSPTSTPAQDTSPHLSASYQVFSWLSPNIRHLPGAELAAATYDLSQGIALVLEIVEQSDGARDDEVSTPLLARNECATLLRYAIASAQALSSQAWQCIEWFDEHGTKTGLNATTS